MGEKSSYRFLIDRSSWNFRPQSKGKSIAPGQPFNVRKQWSWKGPKDTHGEQKNQRGLR